jgi:GNAT superfamily N-acetyltransferase
MNHRIALQRLDFERRTIPDLDVNLETTPYVVRAISKLGLWNGIVYTHFPSSVAEAVIAIEISYFATLCRSFEWKIYSHDEPADLLTRLQNRGFNVGAEESLMILDLRELSPELLLSPDPEGITVTAVADDEGIGHFLSLEAAIWGDQAHTSRAFLRTALESRFQGDRAFIAYSGEKPIGFGRVTVSQGSQFAGLWGGSVLPEFRRRGVYRALLAARIQHARRFDSVRYFRVDALPTSRPILERNGFARVASTWPANSPPTDRSASGLSHQRTRI